MEHKRTNCEHGMTTKISRSHSTKTCNSLLEAAGRIFAEKGYHNSTIAEIASAAGVNIAAVSYHFGGKETLYREAWRHSFRESIAAHPPDRGVWANASAEERLGGQIVALLARVTDVKDRAFRIAQKELSNPTGLFEEVVREELEPLQERIEALVGQIIHAGSREHIRLCAISVIGQCITPALITRIEKRSDSGKHGFFCCVDNIDQYAKHVVAFSLAGLKAADNEE